MIDKDIISYHIILKVFSLSYYNNLQIKYINKGCF